MSKISDQDEKAIKYTDQGKYQKAVGFFDELVETMKEFDSELFNEVITKITPSFKIEEVAEGKLSSLDKANAIFANSQDIISASVYAYVYHDMSVESLDKKQDTDAFDYSIKAASILKKVFDNHQFMPSILKNLNIAIVRVIESHVNAYIKEDKFDNAATLIETMFEALNTTSLQNKVDIRLLDTNLGICYNKINKHELALEHLYKVISKIPNNLELSKTLVAFIADSSQKIIESSDNSEVVLNTLLKMVSALPQDVPEAKIVIDYAKSKLVIAEKANISSASEAVSANIDDSQDIDTAQADSEGVSQAQVSSDETNLIVPEVVPSVEADSEEVSQAEVLSDEAKLIVSEVVPSIETDSEEVSQTLDIIIAENSVSGEGSIDGNIH